MNDDDRGHMEPIKPHRQSQAAFTLVELMVVVAIIGVLSAIAIPLFSSHQLRTKSSEGKVNLGAIRVAEEIYFSESGTYLAATAQPTSYKNTSPVEFQFEDTNYEILGWAPEGRVYFSYTIGITPLSNGFTAVAMADIDGDDKPQVLAYIKPDTSDVKANAGACFASGSDLEAEKIGHCYSSFSGNY